MIEGYLNQLKDLLCIAKSYEWDQNTKRIQSRKPGKLHFTNTLCALSLGREVPHDLASFAEQRPELKAKWFEWIVAQELWRRAAIAGSDLPEAMAFWRSSDHEIDFVTSEHEFIEVKSGHTSPMDFMWFPRSFTKKKLLVVNKDNFQTDFIKGQKFEDFLRERPLTKDAL